MYKIKLMLLLTLVLSACRSLNKAESKRSDIIKTDSASNSFNRRLSSTTITNVDGVITQVELEYPPLTQEEKANGQTEPKPRVKKFTKTEFKKTQSQAKTDSSAHVITALKKQEEHKADNTKKVVKAGFSIGWLWLLVPIALVIAAFWFKDKLGLTGVFSSVANLVCRK